MTSGKASSSRTYESSQSRSRVRSSHCSRLSIVPPRKVYLPEVRPINDAIEGFPTVPAEPRGVTNWLQRARCQRLESAEIRSGSRDLAPGTLLEHIVNELMEGPRNDASSS